MRAQALEIPAHLRQFFTDNEADELIAQFQESDRDGSGSIDEKEFIALLARLSLIVSDAEAGELVASIDTDGNGLIEFRELAAMVVRIKQGDSKLSALQSFVQSLNTTPLTLIEREAKKFGLQITYQLLEEQPGTAIKPPMYRMELAMAGKWCSGPNGRESIQAVGTSTREAKWKAAEAALCRLRKLQPGLAYEPGTLPDEWQQWLFDNIQRGAKINKLLRVLTEKGFSPANNLWLMQKLSARVSSRQLRLKRNSDKSIYEDSSKDHAKAQTHVLHPQWAHWSQRELQRGIDGRIVLMELIEMGYQPEKNPMFTQTLQRFVVLRSQDEDSASQSVLTSTVVQSRSPVGTFTFWSALANGHAKDVELFVYGGQDVNTAQVDDATRTSHTPLQIACRHGHAAIVRFLLDQGAHVDEPDEYQRTPLMIAARHSHRELCTLLIAHGASIFTRDHLNNTPLHMAAFGGCSQIADFFLRTHDQNFLSFLADLPHKRSQSYTALMKTTYGEVMRQNLRENQSRRFHVTWCLEAALWLHRQLFRENPLVPVPTQYYMNYLLGQYHGKLVQHVLMDDDEDDDADKQDQQSNVDWISLGEMTFYVDKCFRETYKNLPNKQGRTALHVACEENLVCTHELVIHRLAEKHGCSPLLLDHGAHIPMQLMLLCRGRPGSPRGDFTKEMVVIEQRHERLHLKDAQRELERIASRRQAWQQEVERVALDFNELETFVRIMRLAKLSGAKEQISGWDIYEEPLSRNRIFENTRSRFVQRQVPEKVLEVSRVRLGWKEKITLDAHFVEQNRIHPEWEVHRVNDTDLYFFFNRETTHCQWVKPKEAPDEWRTRRVFQDEELFEDYEDQEKLRVDFSGLATALKKHAKRGRTLGQWRECIVFGVTFYLHTETDQVSLIKPDDVIRHESYRYAHVLIRERSEEIEEHSDGWKRYYDPTTSHTFYYDEFSGDCVHDANATKEFLQSIRKNKRRSKRTPTKEELQRLREEQEWKQALERARRRDQQAVDRAQEAQELEKRKEVQDDELEKEIRKLEKSVMSEHFDPNGKGLAYIDARYKRELEIYLQARKDGLMTSLNPAFEDPRNEIERTKEMESMLDDQECEHVAIEDQDAKNASCERRRVSRILARTMERMRERYELCRWGCDRWFPLGASLEVHERHECAQRLMVCRLGCARVMKQVVWRQVIYAHESESDVQCSSRIVSCPRDCGVWMPHLQLDHHTRETCVKRPVGDLFCRLGCGRVYQGGAHELLALEQIRIAHEQDDCVLRKVECTWPKCRAILLAKDRNEHRRTHLLASGIMTFLTAEVHAFKVPKDMKLVKIQAWGAGGGSGHLKGQMVGHGGGGAFVESIVRVIPGETLYFSIGSGGKGGKHARMAPCEDEANGDPPELEQQLNSKKKPPQFHIETYIGVADGGFPGGGNGHSGNKECACGGGGGFTSVYREGPYGIEYLIIAAGGGGGGTSRHGLGGGDCKARQLKDGDELRCGRMGDASVGGESGECDASNPVCRFVGTSGSSLQGGHAAEYGGGGGGGLFGGGGGGFAPGIVGGGGGGSSFLNPVLLEPEAKSGCCVEPGTAIHAGGLDRNPPKAVRDAYWDVVDALVGQGGKGSVHTVADGNHGGVRIARPRFFNDMKFHQ